jgi:TetR/AcrR family transcriptional repressor of nem operon
MKFGIQFEAGMSKGDDTKQRIIEKAAEMFNKKGYEGSSLSALMEATGLQKGGIYRHFTSKEELAADAFDYAWGAAREARLYGLDVTAGAIPQLKQLIANFVDRRGPVPGGCPLVNTGIDSDDGNPILRERARKALCEWKERLVTIITAGMKNAEIRSDTEPEDLATVVISSLEGALMMSRISGTNAARRVVQKHLNRLLDDLARPAA